MSDNTDLADLERRLNARIDAGLEGVKRNIAGLERDVKAGQANASDPGSFGFDHSRATKTKIWRCSECGNPLGHLAEGQIRARVRDTYIYTVLGRGGSHATTCTKCGLLNRIASGDESPEPGVVAGMGKLAR